MLYAVTESIGDAVRHFKIHVGDPKGECIFRDAVFSSEIVFKAGRIFLSMTVSKSNRSISISFHENPCPYDSMNGSFKNSSMKGNI